MSNKQKKNGSKISENKGIQIVIGIVIIILLFCGVLKIDDDGSISIAGYETETTLSDIFNNETNNETNSESNNKTNNKSKNNEDNAGAKDKINSNENDSTNDNANLDSNDISSKEGNVNSKGNVISSTEVNENDLYIYYLDVGQADSIFIYNNEETMLIDAGNNEDGKLICDYLESLGITKIDYLVGTHPHEDHIGGLDNIIDSFEIGTIYMPKKSATTKTYEDVIDIISNKKLKVKSPKVGSTFNLGNAVCEIMTKDYTTEEDSDANLSTISIEMTYGTQKYLFTGDMETPNESSRSWNDIDVLKVAHHGSTTSSSKDFLNQTKPEIAIISCGEGNDYGHPHKEILKRLENIDCEVYRTDLLGTILLISDGTTNKLEFLDVSLDGNE